MLVVEGRFDGKVFIPDEAIDLPLNQRGIMRFEPLPQTTPAEDSLPPRTPAADMMALAGIMPKEDAEEMMKAIDEAFGQVDEDGW